MPFNRLRSAISLVTLLSHYYRSFAVSGREIVVSRICASLLKLN